MDPKNKAMMERFRDVFWEAMVRRARGEFNYDWQAILAVLEGNVRKMESFLTIAIGYGDDRPELKRYFSEVRSAYHAGLEGPQPPEEYIPVGAHQTLVMFHIIAGLLDEKWDNQYVKFLEELAAAEAQRTTK